MKFLAACGVILFLTLLMIAGCATEARFEMIMGSWVGATLDEFKKAYGEPKEVFLGTNGNRVFVYKLRGRDCTVFWEVDQRNVIVQWKHEGPDCKQEPNII